MDDLKPCPWCGHTPSLLAIGHMTMVDCGNDECAVQPEAYARSRDEAITAWNTRASAPAATETREPAVSLAAARAVEGENLNGIERK